MKKQFTYGLVTGMASLALAVPALAQISSAQSAQSTSAATTSAAAPPFHRSLTQADVQAMIDRDASFLANADQIKEIQKTVTQAHKDALTQALAITDDTARREAVKKAQDDMRASVEAAIAANPNLKAAMMPFGPGGRGGRGGGHGGMRHGPWNMAQKLGMTPEEVKTAIDSGKTIEQIATEKGITLPAKGMRMHGGGN